MLADAEVFAIIIGLSQVVKEAGKLSGAYARLLSIGVGVIVGTTFKVSQAVPVDFSGWFQAVLYGLVQGLTAAGVYSVVANQVSAARAAPPAQL